MGDQRHQRSEHLPWSGHRLSPQRRPPRRTDKTSAMCWIGRRSAREPPCEGETQRSAIGSVGRLTSNQSQGNRSASARLRLKLFLTLAGHPSTILREMMAGIRIEAVTPGRPPLIPSYRRYPFLGRVPRSRRGPRRWYRIQAKAPRLSIRRIVCRTNNLELFERAYHQARTLSPVRGKRRRLLCPKKS